MSKPKKWWKNPKIADYWVERAKHYKECGDNSDESVVSLVGERFKSVLEVGAGDGRIIGLLSEKYRVKCSSIDINGKLSHYVHKKYSKVETYAGEIIRLPFKDNQFDLVFTFQVLQHVSPIEIEKALRELVRVAKKEVWCFEGIGKTEGYSHGMQTCTDESGSWVWHIDEIVECKKPSFRKWDPQFRRKQLYIINAKKTKWKNENISLLSNNQCDKKEVSIP